MKHSDLLKEKDLTVFTDTKFLGEGVVEQYNAEFLSNAPEFSIDEITYINKKEKEETMRLANCMLMLTDKQGKKFPAKVTYNASMSAVLSQTGGVAGKVFGVEGTGIVSVAGNEYNRYGFRINPLNVAETEEKTVVEETTVEPKPTNKGK